MVRRKPGVTISESTSIQSGSPSVAVSSGTKRERMVRPSGMFADQAAERTPGSARTRSSVSRYNARARLSLPYRNSMSSRSNRTNKTSSSR